VGHVTGKLNTLATAYAFSGDVSYARSVRAILLRFAEVFPNYLVRAGYGYGEYADCDPHIASERIDDLPCDELVYPPNKPDRKIWTGYWSASRIGSSGMDGGWVCSVTQAYDFTCEARDDAGPVYSEEERVRIERDVLLEGAYLALCDPAINNKSVGNRTGAAMVGLCVGHPGLVRFGLEGFERTVEEWFLPDGGTSESAAYALMTMGGIRNFGLAFRDYTDPEGYTDPNGDRLEGFNAFRDTRYGDCWQGLIWTLQGDLRHAPLADSYKRTSIGSHFAEIIALAYPTDAHVALLKELAGETPEGSSRQAILYREPGLAEREVPSFNLPDVVFPFLAQGHIRRGAGGRQGLAMLDASDWGGHHHYDSLNLYYWQDGHELLSDLGYLWDHPDKPKTARAFAHNLVVIDGENQRSQGRGGSYHLFSLTPAVKVMEASSTAYPQTSIYRRTCMQVDHGDAGSYLVDIFRAGGGRVRDYVFHGPGQDYELQGLRPGPAGDWQLYAPAAEPTDYDPDLENLRLATGEEPWRITWRVNGAYEFAAWSPGAPGEQVIVGDGWGQRDHKNTDHGAILPYIVRRQEEAGGSDTFVTVFTSGPAGAQLVRGVRFLAPEEGSGGVVIEVETGDGVDVVVSQPGQAELMAEAASGEVATDARAAAIVMRDGQATHACLIGGTRLTMGDLELSAPRAHYRGAVKNVASGDGASVFVLDGELPDDDALVGQTLLVTGEGGIERGYPIRAVNNSADGVELYTKVDHVGFEARLGRTWELPSKVTWQR
ncbi:MAG: heparinase II/III family protein, partial [Candidatus Latescibacteria bacterium]|nr:heparinase II/III family protein [Candidatus Latescibacterota bacterium]